jgi:hypothetical protein
MPETPETRFTRPRKAADDLMPIDIAPDRDDKREVKRERCGGRAVTGDVAGDFADASRIPARRP